MSRRRSGSDQLLEDVFDLLRHSPWWMGPILIVLVYGGVAWGVPWAAGLGDDPSKPIRIGKLIGDLAPRVAPWLAGLVGMVWIVALIAKWRDVRRLDRQRGIDTIRELTWREFEQLLAEAFRRQGYEARETPKGADGGVDIVLTRRGERVLVQCKHWKRKQVGVQPVRELLGVVTSEGADAGVFVISGTYTADAMRFAERNNLRLIDGRELEGLIRAVRRGGVDAAVPASTPTSPAEPACPTCGATMVMRTARRGARAGELFWGCTTYPRCRGTRPTTSAPAERG